MDPTLPVEFVTTRANHLIDPMHLWGWEIALYLFVGGLVAGLMILLPALEWRSGKPETVGLQAAPWVGAGLLSAGMLALLADLEHPLHVFRFYLAFVPSAPMSWGGWIVGAVYPALGLLGLALLGEPLRSRLPAPLMRWVEDHRVGILRASFVMGIALGTYTGVLFGTMPSRALWNTPILGPLFLASGVSAAAAAMILLGSGKAQHLLARWDSAAIVVELGLLGLFLVGLSTGGTESAKAAGLLLGGAYTPWFWSLVVVGGLLVPLLLNVLELRGRPATRLAPILVLVGGLALRSVLVAAGQETLL